MEKEKINIKKIKLYDPHPGRMGCPIPLPQPMKKIADSLDGKIMTLTEAIDIINSVAKKYNGVIEDGWEYISFEFTRNNIKHRYRLIRYNEIRE